MWCSVAQLLVDDFASCEDKVARGIIDYQLARMIMANKDGLIYPKEKGNDGEIITPQPKPQPTTEKGLLLD